MLCGSKVVNGTGMVQHSCTAPCLHAGLLCMPCVVHVLLLSAGAEKVWSTGLERAV
jgi:hypothetical protein